VEYDKVIIMRLFLSLLFILFSFDVSAEENGKVNYVTATQKSIADLTWRYNFHDMNSNAIIDEYIMLKNCGLYDAYINEDFEWQRIRKGLRNKLKKESASFPDRFEINALIPIGRYDFDLGAFHIQEDAKLDNAGAIILPFDEKLDQKCATKIVGSDLFPRFVKFIADNRFSMTHIPVARDKAQSLIATIRKYRYEGYENQRVLPVRFRIKVNSIEDYRKKVIASELILRGQLDEIVFFQDPNMTQEIWSKSFKVLN
jgi:hypothetical protein